MRIKKSCSILGSHDLWDGPARVHPADLHRFTLVGTHMMAIEKCGKPSSKAPFFFGCQADFRECHGNQWVQYLRIQKEVGFEAKKLVPG